MNFHHQCLAAKKTKTTAGSHGQSRQITYETPKVFFGVLENLELKRGNQPGQKSSESALSQIRPPDHWRLLLPEQLRGQSHHPGVLPLCGSFLSRSGRRRRRCSCSPGEPGAPGETRRSCKRPAGNRNSTSYWWHRALQLHNSAIPKPPTGDMIGPAMIGPTKPFIIL